MDPATPLLTLGRWIVRVVNGLGGLEPVFDLCGLSLPKRIRVRIAILRDPGRPLGMTATPSAAQGPLDELQNIFWTEAHVTLAGNDDRVRVLADLPPESALRVGRSSVGLRRAEAYFRRHLGSGRARACGYREPVTVFIVNEVAGDAEGAADALSGGYVVLERGLLEKGTRALAHRIAHVCGLRHIADEANLMAPKRHGRELRRWQKAVVRNSPHVTHF